MDPIYLVFSCLRTSMKKLISFLGTGAYGQCTYSLGDRCASRTRYMTCAAAELYAVDETVVLTTKEARIAHGALILAESRRLELSKPRLLPIGSGDSTTDLWKTFEILKRELREHGDDRQTLSPDDEVILDITHGFRSQPFFASAVLSFVRTVDLDGPKVTVVYGAWDARTGGPPAWETKPFAPRADEPTDAEAPIWDLTSFIDVIDWADALTLFLKTGRPSGLDKLRNKAPELVDALIAFGEDLVTGRTGSMLLGSDEHPSSARVAFNEVVAYEAKVGTSDELRPLLDVPARLRGWLEPLQTDCTHLSGEASRPLLYALAKRYHDLERYHELFGTIREGAVSITAGPETASPGLATMNPSARKKAEQETVQDKDMREVRNDLMHMGYREHPAKPSEIRRLADEALQGFAEPKNKKVREYQAGCLVWVSPKAPPEELPAGVVATLKERANTQQLIEVPFVPAPATASTEDLFAVVDKVVRAASKHGKKKSPKIAVVDGDPAHVWALVHGLQTKRFRCYGVVRDMEGEVVGMRWFTER